MVESTDEIVAGNKIPTFWSLGKKVPVKMIPRKKCRHVFLVDKERRSTVFLIDSRKWSTVFFGRQLKMIDSKKKSTIKMIEIDFEVFHVLQDI